MISVRLNNLNLKYQRFTPSGCKDIGIRKSEFVTKTQFLFKICKSIKKTENGVDTVFNSFTRCNTVTTLFGNSRIM